ncbi:hypothetical protein E3P99_01123 [Wallemia hederae]|uniref:cysteine synthase n=1 Tax=Wallemia hederae TaxID=1540922 RepID=A0A4T0FTB5_9BASI|nr:hypothetical protein E3P99_01123 [Wallemia hederae]
MRSDQRQYFVAGFASIVALSSLYAAYKIHRRKKPSYAYDDDEEDSQGIIIEDNRQIADGLQNASDTDTVAIECARSGYSGEIHDIKTTATVRSLHAQGKCEFQNPGGSVKDRVALRIIQDAEDRGDLIPHTDSCIFEGTVGSTGISIAMVSKARGYRAAIIMPDDVSAEKADILLKLGAEVEKVRPASIIDKKQFVNLAKIRASQYTERKKKERESDDKDALGTHKRTSRSVGYFADQFERLSNWRAHYDGTAREIWSQTENGSFDAFVSGAGTGGTISGCATYFKERNDTIKIILSDPEGSGLYNRVKFGVMFASQEKEGTKRRHQVDSVVEGIGINRVTANFEQGSQNIDDAVRVSDEDAVAMSRYVMANDGLFLGSSSACNLVAAVHTAKKMEKGTSIVTILCDSGSRHLSRFWDDNRLNELGITVKQDIDHLLI